MTMQIFSHGSPMGGSLFRPIIIYVRYNKQFAIDDDLCNVSCICWHVVDQYILLYAVLSIYL